VTVADLTISREIVIDAPVDVVWRTITEPDRIAEWFADSVDIDVRPGGAGTLVFDDRATAQTTKVALVVEDVDPPHRFAFRWTAPGADSPAPGTSTRAEFTLTEEGDERTRLRVTETGHDELGWPDEDVAGFVDDHRRGWDIHLGRLVILLSPTSG
jgi:uncharacterized protein YndB with AHSA1/START domain